MTKIYKINYSSFNEKSNMAICSFNSNTGTRHLYANGLTNPTYHALEAMAVNAIEEEETADFEDINIPL